MPETSQPMVLSYLAPQDRSKESSLDAACAAALALPGLCGFGLLAGALLFESDLAWRIGPRVGIVLWVIAFACAVFSFVYFCGRRKSGWVTVCLVFNWLGVIFALTPPGWIVLLLALAGAE